MARYDRIDLRFSADGDLELDPGGGLIDTALYPLLSLKQEIMTRVLTNAGDWRNHPRLGTNLQQFVGEKLDDETIQDLVDALTFGLTANNLIDERDLTIEWAQWDAHTLAILITVEVGALDLDGEGRLEIPFNFDFNDLGVIPYDN